MAAQVKMPPAMEHLQSTLTYQFMNPRHLLEALRTTGSGYNIYQSRTVTDGNKRLAQLGDAVMELAVLEDWYASGTERGL
jgi:dsRNA-specific ribonuclease